MNRSLLKPAGLSRLLFLLILALGFCLGLGVAVQGGEPLQSLGSGDGRIQVIPALSAPSVKNGERLTIQAVVKAQAGVARVEANIAGVTRLELKPVGQNCGMGGSPMIPDAPAGMNVQNHGRDARSV